MNLNSPSKAVSQLTHNELNKKGAIHAAGHAVAIYLGSRQKQLSPFFQIYIKKERTTDFQLSRSLYFLNDKPIAKSEDEQWIHTIPVSIEKAVKDISSEQMQLYDIAFEVDVISLLVGPLAEAKYVAMRDGEPINPRLVNLNALHYYGGTSDLEIVNEYLECFISDEAEREKKISGLFLDAFSFIDERLNWLAITMLANYILTARKTIIDYEEVMPFLLSHLSGLD